MRVVTQLHRLVLQLELSTITPMDVTAGVNPTLEGGSSISGKEDLLPILLERDGDRHLLEGGDPLIVYRTRRPLLVEHELHGRVSGTSSNVDK